MIRVRCFLMWLGGLLSALPTSAATFYVATGPELTNALSNAQSLPNSEIILAPGTYSGHFSAIGVVGLTVRSSDPSNPGIIDATGANDGFWFSKPVGLTLLDLEVRNAAVNGINIDDGGDLSVPARDVTLRNVTVRNIGSTGNQDGIKMSGIVGFHIDRVRVIGWGVDGGGIDIVGSHDGLIENSLLDNSRHSGNALGSGIRPKGGSSNIVIRANRIVEAGGRPLQAGGSTGDAFFRPPLSELDPPYAEAEGIIAEGNVVVRGTTGVSWVNTPDGIFRNNVLYRPRTWALRILNEHGADPDFVVTANGEFLKNVILFSDSPDDISRTNVANVGPNTDPASFIFDGNWWYNFDTPANSMPTSLPTTETNGVYGIDPGVDVDGVVAWEFDWGLWLVNANDADNSLTLESIAGLFLATPDGGTLDLGLANPFVDGWAFTPLTDPTLHMEALSQAFVTSIPEPGAVVLLLMGAVAIVFASRRRCRRSACGRAR